ncbi:MAG: nucleoside deaminase [Acidimicrobiales bacterium]
MPTFSEFDRELMAIALDEAQGALAHGDVPIGAVVAVGDRVIARRHNERELTGDPTAHAEVLALRDAASALGGWRFDGATLVVTIEPCVMCAGAAHQARLSRVVFGAFDLKAGALGSLYNVGVDARLNHEFAVDGGLMAEQCGALVSQFFTRLRLDP